MLQARSSAATSTGRRKGVAAATATTTRQPSTPCILPGRDRLAPGEPHYYRLQGPRLLIEWDNTQSNANHAHSVWRDPTSDFGLDVLARTALRITSDDLGPAGILPQEDECSIQTLRLLRNADEGVDDDRRLAEATVC